MSPRDHVNDYGDGDFDLIIWQYYFRIKPLNAAIRIFYNGNVRVNSVQISYMESSQRRESTDYLAHS